MCFNFQLSLFFVGIPIGFTNFGVGIEVCAKTSRIKTYRSIFKKKHDEIVLLVTYKLNTINRF